MQIAKAIRNFSAMLAGFQLAISLVGFFSLTALAKWIVSEWIPFTRWVWDQISLRFNLPIFSDIEKDALTNLAFFTPMAISSVVFYIVDGKNNENRPNYPLALILGFGFFIIMGRDVIQEIFRAAEDMPTNFVIEALEPLVELVTVVYSASIMLFFIVFIVPRFFGKEIELDHHIFKWFFYLVAASCSLAAIFYLSLFSATMFEFVMHTPATAGVVVFGCFVAVIISLMVTVYFDASRMSVVFGALTAFVLSSFVYDGVMWLAGFIEGVA
jgi:hypothetical protein